MSVNSIANFRSLVKAATKALEVEYENFEYADMDSLENEINEFYSISETAVFYEAQKYFKSKYPGEKWRKKSESEKRHLIHVNVEALEMVLASEHETLREYRTPANCLLYLMQGVFEECSSVEDQIEQMIENCKLIHQEGGFHVFVNALVLTFNVNQAYVLKHGNSETWYDDLVLYLTLLYFLVMTNFNDFTFVNELATFQNSSKSLIVHLFDYIKPFNDKNMQIYPLKKILLLLWKCLLCTLGGADTQLKMMNFARKKAGLPPVRQGIYTKNSQADLDNFNREIASKFYGRNPEFDPKKNSKSSSKSLLHTLPTPIREGYETLEKNLYVPLSKIQLQEFEDLFEKIQQNKVGNESDNSLEKSMKNENQDEELPFRISQMNSIYKQIHTELPHYLIILLKVLLATVPSTRKYTGPNNLLSELRINKKEKLSLSETLQDDLDSMRHREIISKAVSAILILLLKHSKISHILQHEYISQILVEANCILLILKFLNQDMSAYASQQNDLKSTNFFSHDNPQDMDGIEPPVRVEGEQTIKIERVCWRNVFTIVNLLRVLQKLTKGKNSRVNVLIQYKAPGILKRTMKLPHSPLPYYSYKLMKSQLPYLERKWINSNMKTVSAIMLETRPKYTDKNLLLTEEESQPITAEEMDYSHIIEAYHHICCHASPINETDKTEEDLELDKDFEENYHVWLDEEVFEEDDELEEDELVNERPPSPEMTDLDYFEQ